MYIKKKKINDIVSIVEAFGSNTHTLADFYAHSNWVDSPSRGGNYRQYKYNGYIPGTLVRKIVVAERGTVPKGLGKTVVWNEKVNSSLYTGTAEGCTTYTCIRQTVSSGGSPGNPVYYHNVVNGKDILGIDDKTTHAYWAKDTPGKQGFKIARDLAIKHTILEVKKLWDASLNNPGLRKIYAMSANNKKNNKVIYKNNATCSHCIKWQDSDSTFQYINKYMKKNGL